jgi:alpha-amylase/alpha-mannosidase (GH57 family)
MERYVCVHGHFYQPPRENPWLEDIELQDSASPYHDWNEKITEECYRRNAASRILDSDKRIIDIVNNYSKISFDFGPTLLSWLQRHAPDVYQSVLDADKKSQKFFSGHGAAMAQVYNHIIMPLANTADKHTQIIWGIRDFESRFGRKPEGMWLPETAVDLETLEILAGQQIKFTVLAPHQARWIRRLGETQWTDVNRDKLDTSRPYLCRLASGRSISLFFYHGATAMDVAGGRLLTNGEAFARKLAGLITNDGEPARLAHIATDGETYGHHHLYTDMALAYCLHLLESNKLAKITVYGEYLERYPPTYEVEIHENTSWSCTHGIERWRANCGCNYGTYRSGAQQWRAPLRNAMDWLRDQLAPLYESRMVRYQPDPWQVRNEYISVVNDRSIGNVENFISKTTGKELSYDEKIEFLKLLEMERNAMLMYTSCGWFFDDICGIEGLQIMQYAARAIQLAKEIDGKDFEPGFKNILEKAPTNTKEFSNGREAYDARVKSSNVDLNRVGAHLAVSSVFEQQPKGKVEVYCYTAEVESYERVNAGIQSLAAGRATIQSNILLERHPVDFAVLHFGDQNLLGAVNARMPDNVFSVMRQNMETAFYKGDTTEVMRLMSISFAGNTYSLWHLFKDQQRRILYELLTPTWRQIAASFEQIYQHNYTIMQIMRGMNMPLPKALSAPAEFVLNQEICRELRDAESDLAKLRRLVDEADRLSLKLDETTIRFEAARKINRLMDRLESSPDDVGILEIIEATLGILSAMDSHLDLQKAQNVFFSICSQKYPDMNKKADSGDERAKKWVHHFQNLARYLDVCVQ